VWTRATAESELARAVANAEAECDRHIPWWRNDTDIRQDVAVMMMFNMGWGKFGGFHKTLAAWQAGDYEAASVEMLDSLWAKQVGKRAQFLSRQLATDEHQDRV
jgi:lysozyme